jgi:hypothetical protein
MSHATPADDPARPDLERGAPDGTPSRPAIARLPTWVNVVLVLTLIASCSAASTAGEAVDQMIGGAEYDSVATEAEVRDLCRLLGAVAARQDVDLGATFAGGDTDTMCEAAAREAATP